MTIRRVDKDSTDPSPDGTTWAKAYKYLQDAIAASGTGGDEIWVADGTYIPSKTGTRTDCFTLKNSMQVYGGFNGTETLRTQRDWVTNVTILSGDLNGDDGDPFTNRSDNSYAIVKTVNWTYNHVLDGFTIKGANGGSGVSGGGVIIYRNGNSIVRNCIFISNESGYGGALYAGGNSWQITIDNCTFNYNRALAHAGALWIYGAHANVSNCGFTGNYTQAGGGHGGAASFFGYYSNTCTVSNCTFTSNTGTTHAGAFSVIYGGKVNVTNSTFTSNTSPAGGAIIVLTNSYMGLTNCEFINNTVTSSGYGGAIDANANVDNMVWSNCTFRGNTAVSVAGAVSIGTQTTGTISMQGCTFRGNSANEAGAIFLNAAKTSITDCYFYANVATTYSGVLSIVGNCTPQIARCVFAGNSANYGGAIRIYLNTYPNFTDCIFSGNAATSYGGAFYSHYNNVLPSLVRCSFVGNIAGLGGGGVYITENGAIVFEECLFAGNTVTTGRGGAVALYSFCGGTFINCTGIKNKSLTDAGGYIYSYRSPVIIRNNVVWGNTALNDASGQAIFCYYPGGSIDIDYTDFQGGLSGTGSSGLRYSDGATLTDGGHNINSDPLWSESLSSTWSANSTYDSATGKTTLTKATATWATNYYAGLYLNPDTAQSKYYHIVSNTATTIVIWGDVSAIGHSGDTFQITDFRLQRSSPCRNTGSVISSITSETDLASKPRTQNGYIDMGCYEHVIQGASLLRRGFEVASQSINPTVNISGAGLIKPTNDSCVSAWETDTGGIVVCTDTNTSTQYPWLAVKTSRDVYYREMFAL